MIARTQEVIVFLSEAVIYTTRKQEVDLLALVATITLKENKILESQLKFNTF
jgi:hypothetical protein